MAFEGPAEPADSDHVLRFKTARDVGAGGPSAGLTDTQLRATPVPVSLGTDTDIIGKVGIDQTTPGTTNGVVVNSLPSAGYVSNVTITRPANTTPYTAGDVLGGALTIATIGPTTGHVFITDGSLLPQITAVPAGMTSFRLHLYDATPVSAIADNGAWTFTSTDWPNYLGYVDLGSPVDVGSGLFVQATALNKKVKIATGTGIFGYLVTNGGFTPAGNSEVYSLQLGAVGI